MAAQIQQRYPDYKNMLVFYRCYSSCHIISDYLYKISIVDLCITNLIKIYCNLQVYEYNKKDTELLQESINKYKKRIIQDLKKIFPVYPEYRVNIIFCLVNKDDAHKNYNLADMLQSFYKKIGTVQECNEFIHNLINT